MHARRAERAALWALLATALLTAAKGAAWLATSSLALLSQTLDSLLDVVALALVFVGVRIAGKPADAEHHYGHAKAENLVAFVQTLVLVAVAAGVGLEAVRRLADGGSPVRAPWYALALLGASAAVDGVRAWYVHRAAAAEGSDALRAGALNVATDVGTAVVALASLALVRTGVRGADAAGALVVAVAVAVASVRLGRRSVDVLMDRAPRARVEAIAAAAAAAPGVAEARRVRVRTGGRQLFADVTVAARPTTSLERAHDIAERVEQEIGRVAPGADVVVHVEPAGGDAGLSERVRVAATRAEGVHEVHDVSVHAFEEDGRSKLHVTLHAKVPATTPLEDAHALSDRIEDVVARELAGRAVRVDTHIEPLERTALGRDATRARRDVVDTVRAAARGEPDVLDCHEVLVTDAAGGLAVVAHVRARGDLALARVHDASDRIESAVRRAHDDVASVLIHFEPA
ncbi:MAG TPA: cation diffusion facilitator family transporter [Actinomycetota bacterium]|nr:cation diffusion facilitator family transporter [Actinomycetota bacterium]